jgi:hypothetical protein
MGTWAVLTDAAVTMGVQVSPLYADLHSFGYIPYSKNPQKVYF